MPFCSTNQKDFLPCYRCGTLPQRGDGYWQCPNFYCPNKTIFNTYKEWNRYNMAQYDPSTDQDYDDLTGYR